MNVSFNTSNADKVKEKELNTRSYELNTRIII